MTAGADDGRIQLGRGDRCRIVGMLGQGAMAGLAGNSHMPTLLLLIDDVGVAGFANFVAGKSGGPGRGFRDGSAAVMTVLAKAARNDCNPQNQEHGQQYHNDHGKPDEMFYVLEQFRALHRSADVIQSAILVLYFDTEDLVPER